MILVTGGTGFIGSRITQKLLARGEGVVCFDARPALARLGDVAQHPGLHMIAGDITQFDDLIAAIALFRVDRIIHTAGVLTATSQADPKQAIRVNVTGTASIFEAARILGVTRVTYASSMVVHGNQWDHGDGYLDEDSPLFPHTFYAYTKQMNEATAQAYMTEFGLDCRGLRIAAPFGFGGQTGRPGAEVTRMIALTALGLPVKVQLALGETPPSTYVDDIAEIFIRLCCAPKLSRPIYVCSVSALPIEHIADIIETHLPDACITFAEPGERITLPYRICSSRLEADIGFRLPALEVRIRDHLNEVRRANGLPLFGSGTECAASETRPPLPGD